MSFDLAGRKALVTGASRGIGAAIAHAFAAAGADVALAARTGDDLDVVAREICDRTGRRAVVTVVDMLDSDAIPAAVDRAADGLGGFDILVNNAGGNRAMIPVATVRPAGWRKAMALNLDSVMLCSQAAFPHLSQGTNAAVINISSAAALTGAPLLAGYAAAKAAVISLTRSLALEWAHAGIRVNALIPGWVETDLTAFLRQNAEAEKSLLAQVPMARWARPEEIAEPAVFLASSAASFMTGQQLIIDGGLTA